MPKGDFLLKRMSQKGVTCVCYRHTIPSLAKSRACLSHRSFSIIVKFKNSWFISWHVSSLNFSDAEFNQVLASKDFVSIFLRFEFLCFRFHHPVVEPTLVVNDCVVEVILKYKFTHSQIALITLIFFNMKTIGSIIFIILEKKGGISATWLWYNHLFYWLTHSGISQYSYFRPRCPLAIQQNGARRTPSGFLQKLWFLPSVGIRLFFILLHSLHVRIPYFGWVFVTKTRPVYSMPLGSTDFKWFDVKLNEMEFH